MSTGYDELVKLGSTGADHMQHTRWCHGMAGEEYARIYSWGNEPKRKVKSAGPPLFCRQMIDVGYRETMN